MQKLGVPVVIAHPETGKLITMFKSAETQEEYGNIRVDEKKLVVAGGFSRFANRSAFIKVDKETAEVLEGMLVENEPYPIPGKIIVSESYSPFYPGQEPKRKGKDGETVLSNGKPVYRHTEFTTNMDLTDALIESDKVVVNTANAGNAAE